MLAQSVLSANHRWKTAPTTRRMMLNRINGSTTISRLAFRYAEGVAVDQHDHDNPPDLKYREIAEHGR